MSMLKGKVRPLTVGATALATAGLAAASLALAVGGSANAAGGGGPTPPWESSINTGNVLGGITFYNAEGQVVTGGSITASGFGAYAVASTPDPRSGDSKAGLYMYTPVNGVNPGAWTGEVFTGATTYPATSAPAPISGTSHPYETNTGSDPTIINYLEFDPNTDTSTTDGYAGLYDVRLKASGVGIGIEADYWDTVISVDVTATNASGDPTAGTWSVDYPDWTQKTTTTVTATATSGSLDLSAAVSPATAGTVSFWTGYGTSSPKQVGTSQTVTSSDGTASVTTTTPASPTTYTALYTPAIPDSPAGTGNALTSYDIGSTGTVSYPPAVTTTTTLAATPATTAQQGSSVSLAATVKASNSTIPTGSVNFEENNSSVGTGTVNSSGVATLTTKSLLPSAPGGASLKAIYTPASGTSYGSSTSNVLTYTVNPVAAKPTLTGPHQVGQKETCSEGKLSTGVTASYAWTASGKSVGSGATLTVPASAYKKSLECTATVVDGTGPKSSATSASVTVVVGKALTAVKKPTLSGSHKVGKTERVKPGKWSQSKVTFTYQWLLNGKVIKHATKSTFKPSKSDKGKKLSCKVTAHLTGYANGSATTASVKVS
jgi:Bacterial Ig-like domain (group 3)